MEDYSYDNSLEWIPREYPTNEHYTEFTAYIDYPMPPPPVGQRPAQARPQQAQYAQQATQAYQPRQFSHDTASAKRMSKGEALDLLESLKITILAGALIGFFVLSALVATHLVGSASNNAPSPGPSFRQGPPDDGNNGGFFNQQGGNNGGFQFGGGGGQPSSGSGVS